MASWTPAGSGDRRSPGHAAHPGAPMERRPGLRRRARPSVGVACAVIVLALGLASCAEPSTPAPLPPATAVGTTPVAAVGTAGVPTQVPIPGGTALPTPLPASEDAEAVAFTYYAALGRQQWDVARALLAPDLRGRMTEADLEASVAGTEAVGLVVIIPHSVTPSRIFFDALVSARTTPGAEGEWSFGANARYLELVATPEGWRIARISTTRIDPSS